MGRGHALLSSAAPEVGSPAGEQRLDPCGPGRARGAELTCDAFEFHHTRLAGFEFGSQSDRFEFGGGGAGGQRHHCVRCRIGVAPLDTWRDGRGCRSGGRRWNGVQGAAAELMACDVSPLGQSLQGPERYSEPLGGGGTGEV